MVATLRSERFRSIRGSVLFSGSSRLVQGVRNGTGLAIDEEGEEGSFVSV